MKIISNFSPLILSIILTGFVSFTGFEQSVSAQNQSSGVALQRGFRTGYSDGYMSGYRDTIDSIARNYARHSEYTSAERAYSKDYGPLDDYRDGYQQGFESGYDTGYDRRSFESSLPGGLKKRGKISSQKPLPENASIVNSVAINNTYPSQGDDSMRTAGPANNYQSANGPIILIPVDTELVIELADDLDTQQSREGQKFTAKIVSPSEIAGATIEGRVAKVLKPGRFKRRSELLLAFDRIILNDTRWSNFSATLTEVLAVKGDNVARVDNEGTAIGQRSLKSDAIKVGGATGVGLVTGAVVAGPVGAVVGAGMGAAFGVGAVVIDRGKHIKLNKNQQLRIKTAHETQIR